MDIIDGQARGIKTRTRTTDREINSERKKQKKKKKNTRYIARRAVKRGEINKSEKRRIEHLADTRELKTKFERANCHRFPPSQRFFDVSSKR